MQQPERRAPAGTAALRVIECGSGISAAYCGWLLRRLGAEVERAGPTPPAPDLAQPDAIGLGLAYFHHGKTVLPAGAAPAWSDADLIITDDVAALEALAGCALAALAERAPQAVIGATTVFGLSGPLAGTPAVPLDAQAVSSVAWALGEPGRAPLSIPPGVLECQAGAHLAAACLMARFVSPADGQARIADVALADVLASYVAVNCRFYIHHGMQWQRAGRRASNSGGAYPFVILPCKDGDVCLSGRTRPEWERFVQAMGSPDWAREPRYQKLRAMGQQYPEEVDALILPWLAEHTKAEIEAIANRYQLTIAPLRSFAEVLATDQLADRGFLAPWQAGPRTFSAPGLPFKMTQTRGSGEDPDLAAHALSTAGGARGAGGKAAGPLAGLRVLDLGWVWSAPQVGSILAQFGAEVVKVEHAKRLDNSRMSGTIFRNGEKVEGSTTDMSPMFHQINKGKSGITLNTKHPDGVALARRLAAQSDIVLENMSAGSMERTGLGYDTLRQDNPGLIMVAMSGAGQFGPLADMRTYAPAMSSFAGLEAIVGYDGERPVGALNFAVGDPNAAVHALVALFAALLRRQTTNEGCYIDLSQTEAMITTLAPYLLVSQATGHQPAPAGNSHPGMAPHGIYPTDQADRWLSIATETDAQWSALASLAGDAAWAGQAQHTTTAGRIADRAALDAALAGWTETQERDGLVARLRAKGIPASPVQDIDAFWADAQFGARGLRDVVDLPGLGQEPLFRAPWLFSNLHARTGTRGPLLGEDNAQVLQGRLGLSAEAFAAFKAEGVIA